MAIAASITEVYIVSIVVLAPTIEAITENSFMSPEPICLPTRYSSDKHRIGHDAFNMKYAIPIRPYICRFKHIPVMYPRMIN